MKNLELLKSVLMIQSVSYNTSEMVEFITRAANAAGATTWIEKGNLYAIKGGDADKSNYPCIVAHTDTVHKIIPKEHYSLIMNDDFIMAFNTDKKEITGVGGDDKVGIYIALSMLFTMDKIKAVFFRDEEVGCMGSGDCDMTFFDDVRFVLECDRKGNKDFINVIRGDKLQSEKFMNDVKPIINSYNYDFTFGGLTDVSELYKNGLTVCSANMSCGYHNPHSESEVVCISDVFRCEDMVLSIFTSLVDKYEIPKYVPITTYSGPHHTWNNNYNHNNAYAGVGGKWDGKQYGTNGYPNNKMDKNKIMKIKACWSCGEPHTIDSLKDNGLCDDCVKHHAPVNDNFSL